MNSITPTVIVDGEDITSHVSGVTVNGIECEYVPPTTGLCDLLFRPCHNGGVIVSE